MREIRKVLVAGSSGYVGGRLVPRLLERRYKVLCLSRHPELLEGRGWEGAEIARCDLLEPRDLAGMMRGTDAAYYLVHSMEGAQGDFTVRDSEAAANFAKAAADAGVERVVYLGGLGDPEVGLSRHLASRHRVGDILREHGPSVTEFRAAVVVGSGSVSFEMIRYLAERLPLIPLFHCLKTRCQPIAIRDVLHYLIASLEVDASAGRIVEIGGGEVLTYEEMIRIYAKIRGLKRRFIPTKCWYRGHCSSCAKWVGRLTPIPWGYALPLLESLRSEVVCRDETARELFPIAPLDYDTAVRYALRRIRENAVETSWTLSLFPRSRDTQGFRESRGMVGDQRTVEVAAPAGLLFEVFLGIGGERGWFYLDWLWTLRGLVDRLMGGVGMRRGRRHPDMLNQGEPLDFWRVERVVPGRLLLLRAEMRLPGKGWLQFESTPSDEGGSVLRQTAYFEPKGVMGHMYWYSLYPLHGRIFSGLAREIKRRAEISAVRNLPKHPQDLP